MLAKYKKYILLYLLAPYYNAKCLLLRKVWGNQYLIWAVQNVISDDIRKMILVRYGASISTTATIRRGFLIHCPSGKKPFNNLQIGDNTYIDKNVQIDISDKVVIGKDTILGCGVKIYTHIGKHYCGAKFVETVKAPVTIGNDSRCYPNSFIACGVTIGDRVLIGACTFVKAFNVLEDNSLYGGIPAKQLVRYE